MVHLVQSLEFAAPGEIVVHGASQGGGLALVTAALFPEVKKAAVAYPFLSDFRKAYELGGTAYEEFSWFFRIPDPRHEREEELFRKLAYLDVKNFAPSVKAEVMMALSLKDEVCPPPTQFAVYNNLSCPKKQYLYPDFGHEDLPGFTDLSCLFLRNLLSV
jgi:cephalosporin-C deacetylase